MRGPVAGQLMEVPRSMYTYNLVAIKWLIQRIWASVNVEVLAAFVCTADIQIELSNKLVVCDQVYGP